ncbi:MAG TPA: nuclear transport factor 2 family protein [Xanthobacteraceae bacterium]|nr:nuclear transport factor 2 family protein [Xanthobacteraceae bacterium]
MTTLAIEDRLAIEDLYSDYVWALDTGDVHGFLALFVPDGVFGDTAGNRYRGPDAIARYVTDLVHSPPFRGRQHIISGKRFAIGSDGRVGIKAYWLVTKWTKASGAIAIDRAGHSDDVVVKTGGRWLFAQRVVHYWNDTDLPWAAIPKM